MAKADKNSITTAPSSLTPIAVEYTEGNLVEVKLETEKGDPIALTMSAKALLNLVNLTVALVNRDIGKAVRVAAH